MSNASYAYKYRPYFFDPKKGQRGKLIEFFRRDKADQFFDTILLALQEINPQLGEAEELWMVDEISYALTTSLGEVSFNINAYDFIHLEGKNNILDKIEALLEAHDAFERLEVFERDYILKSKKS